MSGDRVPDDGALPGLAYCLAVTIAPILIGLVRAAGPLGTLRAAAILAVPCWLIWLWLSRLHRVANQPQDWEL